ncbi:MaoC family dehydratase [Methylovirgula sp. HY1]|uniref:MaoC family dehydratase n=1 Tax=Methylovirgula sp. HY1 TaxID=2822761 RepID=UPI001C7740AE|nr:MaoC family dehydratase [Methylovirgula sp. HY1]QXX76400.1 (R)-specific enoyl-CoA hydratase [Methylovirgula sp. HY1]
MTATSDRAAATMAQDPPKLGEKFAAQSFGPCSLDDLQRYASASGDDNPIHLDPELARRAGLAAPPVHGMLLMSQFAPALAIWRPDLTLVRLSGKFLRPIFVGETAELSGRVVQVATGATSDEPPKFLLRLMMHNERHEIALIAEAMTLRQTGV